jgi:RND family efflux transporter MFP subunit
MVKTYAQTILARARTLPRWAWVVIIIVIVGLGYLLTRGGTTETAAETQTPEVAIANVGDLSSGAPGLQVAGTVQSISQATVRAEKSGQVVAVYHGISDRVGAGTIVAELEHGTESAALQQAQASVAAARANLAKVTGGARTEQRSILASGVDTAQASLSSAQSGAVNTLLSAYASVDSAISGSSDKLFTNPTSVNPIFTITSSDAVQKSNIEHGRTLLAPILSRERARSESLQSSDDLDAELSKTAAEVREVRDFLDTVISNLNKAIPTVEVGSAAIAANLTSVTAARASINGTLASISAAQASLKNARSGLSVAQQNLAQGEKGGQPEDVQASQAAVAQAQAGLASAQAAYEHSVIRAPISGTVNSFALKVGDFVTAASPVLTVANNGALEIVTYVTEADAKEIVPYSKVSIEGDGTGVVTRIAPAVDPVTKKIEVHVAVDDTDTLVNGQSVLLTLSRAIANTTKTVAPSRITVPISAIKIGPDSASVFTVDDSQKLVSHTVVLGDLLGDRVEIKSGISSDMMIVMDARGLHEGQTVVVKSQ